VSPLPHAQAWWGAGPGPGGPGGGGQGWLARLTAAPGLSRPAGVRGYRWSWLRGDLLAGVTVAAYLVPQVMAYARVAGLRPAAGLWAAVPALVIYAAVGSSRSLSFGPEATTALMTATAIGPLAGGNPARYAAPGSGCSGTASR
jgi:sulfate permease, SulP family